MILQNNEAKNLIPSRVMIIIYKRTQLVTLILHYALSHSKGRSTPEYLSHFKVKNLAKGQLLQHTKTIQKYEIILIIPVLCKGKSVNNHKGAQLQSRSLKAPLQKQS